MPRASWLKKIWNGRSRGVSTVIGTVFLMLIIFMVSTNVLLWTFSQNAQYTQEVKAVNQEEADRRSEKVVATDADYSVSGNEVTVEATLTNAGSVAVQIVNLWVFGNTSQTYGFNNTIGSLNLNLNPGNSRTVSVVVTVPQADQNPKFTSWFVTARGNTVPLEKEQEGIIVAQLAQGIGSLALEFYTFRYYNISGGKLVNYPAGNPTFKIPYDATVAFGFNLTNFDPSKKTITFNETSIMWSYFPASAGQRIGPVWYIANVNPDESINDTYSPISLAWGKSKLFVFAKQDGKWFKDQKNTLGAINLLLYGTFEDGREYAQNIPFVAIYAYA